MQSLLLRKQMIERFREVIKNGKPSERRADPGCTSHRTHGTHFQRIPRSHCSHCSIKHPNPYKPMHVRLQQFLKRDLLPWMSAQQP